MNAQPVRRLSQPEKDDTSGQTLCRGACWAMLLCLAAGLLCLMGCAAPSTSSPAASADAHVLRVGVTATMPPLIFKRSGEYAGVEADLARQLAADLGRTVRFVEVPWDRQIDALLEGRTDIIMSSMSITPARAARIDFTQPYLRSGQTALVRRTEAQALRIGMFSSGCRLGAQRGTTGDYFIQQELPRAKRIEFDTAEAGARALLDKRIDVFIHDAPVNWWLGSENEAKGLTVISLMLTEEYLAWGVRKDDPALRNAANGFLEKARASGALPATIRRWIPQWQ